MKTEYIILFFLFSIVASCQSDQPEFVSVSKFAQNDSLVFKAIDLDTAFYPFLWKKTYSYKLALINNISPPIGYKRVSASRNSFANWLRHLPLNIDSMVYLYNGEKKYNQSAQFMVMDIDVGVKDLQQCADAVMRLRAEYLYASQQYDQIHFNYTNGVNIPFLKWSNGFYPSLKGNKVIWLPSSNNKSYKSFKKYMNNIFMYAGTASLEKELESTPLKNIKPGDVLIKGGFPGHAVIVVDVAINHAANDKVFMLAQSYMPAQSIHILNNFNNSEYSPWYSLKDIDEVIETPEWTFFSNQLKQFKDDK